MPRSAATAVALPSETVLASTISELELHPAVLSHLSLPSDSRPPSAATLTRYLRARGNDPVAAANMLRATLRLPSYPVPCVHCVRNPRAHAFYPIGPTITGEPVAYSSYAAENTDPDANVEHMRFAMDQLLHEESLHRMTWVVDMQHFGRRHLSPSVARRVLGLFADHYPERLRCAILYDAPAIFSGLWSAVKMFADPVTVRKVVFIKHGIKDRRARFEALGIEGKCLDNMLKEIDDARDEEVSASKNWWTYTPLPPLTDIGKLILEKAA